MKAHPSSTENHPTNESGNLKNDGCILVSAGLDGDGLGNLPHLHFGDFLNDPIDLTLDNRVTSGKE